jgi:hypothetical protein
VVQGQQPPVAWFALAQVCRMQQGKQLALPLLLALVLWAPWPPQPVS